MQRLIWLLMLALATTALVACGNDDDDDDTVANDDDDTMADDDDDSAVVIEPGPDAYDQLQTALLDAEEGQVIHIKAGTYNFETGLSLTVPGVTIRGDGMDETVLNFGGQTSGSQGITVSGGSDFAIEDIAIEDTAGDAIKVNGTDGVVMRRVRVEWTGGPDTENGSYGFYPVQCNNVLIEDSVAIGASDAGVYVGQSTNIVVRGNRAEFNVAGIEIENSIGADVYDNLATNNTGGILVFDLPGLQVKGGRDIRVFDNEIVENNTENFAPLGNIVGVVPAGTGLMIMANDNVEVYGNEFRHNQTANIAIVSFEVVTVLDPTREANDPEYDPYPETIYIHSNTFEGGGEDPAGQVGLTLKAGLDTPFPDIIYDGILDGDKTVDGVLPDELQLCIQDNGDADFANIDAENFFANVSYDMSPHDCTHPPLPGITLP